MLTSMSVFSSRLGSPELPLAGSDASTDPIQIRDIQGLGPVKGTINTTPYGSTDGESYSGSSIGLRNIVLILGLNPDWSTQTMSSLRKMLYDYFMVKQDTRLRFFSDDYPDCEILGFVESLEPTMFSKDPEVQISIICPSPDFVAVDATTVTGSIDDGSTHTDIDYEGSMPTGFVLVSSSIATPELGSITVTNLTPGAESLTATVTDAGLTYFKLSTVQGDKYVQQIYITSDDVVNLLRTVSGGTIWPQLYPGINEFSVRSDTLVAETWTMTYFARFGGL